MEFDPAAHVPYLRPQAVFLVQSLILIPDQQAEVEVYLFR